MSKPDLSSNRQTHIQRLYNARYAKLRLVGRQRDRYFSNCRFRKVISLSTTSGISRKIIRHVTGTKQGVEILSVQFSDMRCDKRAMITQDDIIKVACYISGMTDVVSCFAVLCNRDLSGMKSEFLDFLPPRTCNHKRIAHVGSDRPVVIDIRVVAKANWRLPDNRFFVDATYANIRNAA